MVTLFFISIPTPSPINAMCIVGQNFKDLRRGLPQSQAIGAAQPIESLNNLRQCTQKYQAIFVILENRFAPITSQYEGVLPWALVHAGYREVTIRELTVCRCRQSI